jgi:hypothetical protein
MTSYTRFSVDCAKAEAAATQSTIASIQKLVKDCASSGLVKPFGGVLRDLERYKHDGKTIPNNLDLFAISQNIIVEGQTEGKRIADLFHESMQTQCVSPLVLDAGNISYWIWKFNIVLSKQNPFEIQIVSIKTEEERTVEWESTTDSSRIESPFLWQLSVNCLMMGQNGEELIPEYQRGEVYIESQSEIEAAKEHLKKQIKDKTLFYYGICSPSDSIEKRLLDMLKRGWSIKFEWGRELIMKYNQTTQTICMVRPKEWDARIIHEDGETIDVRVYVECSTIREAMEYEHIYDNDKDW